MATSPTLVLVTGLPGTGKSTVAAVAADVLGAAVIAHDWAMSGLRAYPAIQAALDDMDRGHRVVGWSILTALARAQLVENRSVVLDGVARAAEVASTRALAQEVGTRCLVVRTECPDEQVHRRRIEGRIRAIPGWYELTWEEVARAREDWVTSAPEDVDLVLDTTVSKEVTFSRLDAFLTEAQHC